MKRFLALLLVALLMGSACAEVVEPSVGEVSFELGAPISNAAGAEAEEPAEATVEEVTSELGAPSANGVIIRTSPEEIRGMTSKLMAEGQRLESEARRDAAQVLYGIASRLNEVAGIPETGTGTVEGGSLGTFALGVKESLSLPDVGLKFASSDPLVLAVSRSKLTGKKAGAVKIAVKVQDKAIAEFRVRVQKAPSKVTLSEKALTLCLDEIGTLKATLPKKTASAITWSSSKPGIVAVDGEGRLTAVKAGTATITVRTFNKKTATCKVTVLNGTAPKKLSVTKTITVAPGEKLTLSPVLDDGAATVYSFASKNKKIAAVSAKGVVTGKKKGSTTITVKTHNGLTATVKVTVAKKELTELTDLIGTDIYAAVKKLGGKKKDVGTDGKDGYENFAFRKNGIRLAAPRIDYQKKKRKGYRKVNWIVLEKKNKYTILGMKPGITLEKAKQTLEAAGFGDMYVLWGSFGASKGKASVNGYIENGAFKWIGYSVD